MMAVSRSTQFDGSFEGIHFLLIQFLYLYVHIPRSSCCEVGFGQYHMIFIDPDVDETFFRSATFFRKNGMPASLSSLLVFIATIWPTFMSVNGSNSGNTSSRSSAWERRCPRRVVAATYKLQILRRHSWLARLPRTLLGVTLRKMRSAPCPLPLFLQHQHVHSSL